MKKLILCLSILSFASWAGAQAILFDTSVFSDTNIVENYNFSQTDEVVADDAVIASPGVITSLEIDFIYPTFTELNPTVGTADANFSLWSDSSGDPSATPLWSSGITNLTFTPSSFTAGPSSFIHNIQVAVPNVAVGSTLYWSVSLHNRNTAGSVDLGIRKNTELNGSTNPVGDYVPGTDTNYDSLWISQGDIIGATPSFTEFSAASNSPLSVRIFGVAVPEPSMAGLFLIGLGCLGMIRKLKNIK